MRAWEFELLSDAFRVLLWTCGIVSVWVTVFPQLLLPELVVWIRRVTGIRARRLYRKLRLFALVYWLLLLPYGGLLGAELLFGVLTRSGWVRDQLLNYGYSISHFQDQLQYVPYRLWAWATILVVIPAVGIWCLGGRAVNRRFSNRIARIEERHGSFRCVRCEYDLGSPAPPEAICPECGESWQVTSSGHKQNRVKENRVKQRRDKGIANRETRERCTARENTKQA